MNGFMYDGEFCIGANYWASHNSINMWKDWNAEAVEEDFKKLSSYGVRYLRMFLVWPVFQPLKAIWANMQLYEYRMGEEELPLPDTEAGHAGVSEEACGHFAEFCALADKYGIKLIVGLLTGHMSFRFYWPPAFEGRNFLTDPTLIKWEIRFVKYFVKRFREESSIVAWDLGNECNCLRGGIQPDQSYVWVHAISSAIRESDPTRPVVSGLDSPALTDREPFNVRDYTELLDVNTTHPYQIFSGTAVDPINTMRAEIEPAIRSTIYQDLGGKPSFIEEVGSIGYNNNSEKTEAEFLRTMYWSAWAQNCHGLFWWCAFDQGRFDYAPYDWNNYGSDYGLFRADGSAKPVADEAKKFHDFLASYEYADLPAHTTEAVVILPRELQNPLKVIDPTYILAKQANLDVRFAHAEDKLPDAKLYILPSVYSSKPMFLHRLNELLDRVREGASLYFSLGDTLFRRIPELTGLTIASRERGFNETITLGSHTFTLGSTYRYNIESVADTCEVLARGGDGRPVYVCNRYGKGKIYFLTFPLEVLISDRPGIFKSENCTPYYEFYKAFAGDADERVSVGGNPCVLTTEHIVGENRRIIVAVNYADSDKEAKLTLRGGWKLDKIVRGAKDADGALIVGANDAAVLEIVK